MFETAQRMPSIEAAIKGKSIEEALGAISSEHIASLDPLSDIEHQENIVSMLHNSLSNEP